MNALTPQKITRLLKSLNEELKSQSASGELYLVGGAVMCLVFGARKSTADLDAQFAPTQILRAAAKRVAERENVPSNWLNDGVKRYLSPQGDFSKFLELDHLKVMAATPEYLLAMKCLATRIGEEFHDIDDIRFLLRHIGIETLTEAENILARYYPIERFPQKSLYVLMELLTGETPGAI